jgi:hypothetical protein
LNMSASAPVAGWLGDATLKSLAEMEALIEAASCPKFREAGRAHLNALHGSIRLLLNATGEGCSAVEQPGVVANFGHMAVSRIEQLGREAESQGIDFRHEFSPSLERVQFAPGGSVLVGLVRHALSCAGDGSTPRQLTVTASVDGRCRLIIGIQDSGNPTQEQFSMDVLAHWRRRIAALGGELRLRNVPFGSGMTIEASVPAHRIAA